MTGYERHPWNIPGTTGNDPWSEEPPAATDEFRYHTAEAKAGILFIRALEDADVLAAAREEDPWTPASLGFQVIADRMGTDTNPLWITARAAEEAYRRDLIDETEFDHLTR